MPSLPRGRYTGEPPSTRFAWFLRPADPLPAESAVNASRARAARAFDLNVIAGARSCSSAPGRHHTFSFPHMHIHRWMSVLALVAMLPAGAVLSRADAQGITTGAVTGTVTDSTGRPLDAVQIRIRNKATGFVTG